LKNPRLAIDGVFFQLNSTGIARVWYSVLKHWASQPFADEIVVLDRVGSAPKFPGIRYLSIPAYSIGQGDADRDMLQKAVDDIGASLFTSTYYTSVRHTKTLQVVYDMIPEVMGWNVTTEPAWIEKHYAFNQADYFICISQNTRRDLHRFFPSLEERSSQFSYLGVDSEIFYPPKIDQVVEFHNRYAITRPYFLVVGSGDGYKNSRMLFDALSTLASGHGFEVVMATRGAVSGAFRPFVENGTLRILPLADDELNVAYGGALAFVYPSLYEGFGLPILEAMACNCPVISNDKASLPEVGGDAVLYANTAEQLANALCEVQKPEVQQRLIRAGNERIRSFTWETTATKWWEVVCSLTNETTDLDTARVVISNEHLISLLG
jgi:glycosyltransferase involved in cell wall biosynthesis